MRSFKTRFKNLISGVLLVLCCLCVPVLTAQAAERVAYDRALILKPASTNDEIGIAFLKTAGSLPDFGKIIEETDAYKDMNPLAQQDYKSKISAKLNSDFLGFSQKKTDLIVRVKVNVLFTKLPDGGGVMKIRTFPHDPVYFPFYFAKYPIAMIVQGMEVFREIRLDKEETDMVYSRLSLSGDATMLIQLYAVAADDQKQVMLDNIPQYPFLTQIGYIGLLNNQTQQIWAWRNDKISPRKSNGGDGRDIIDLAPRSKEIAK